MRVTRHFQLPLNCELRLEIYRAAGVPQQINVPTLALIIRPGAKQQDFSLRINRSQNACDGLLFGWGQSHGVLDVLTIRVFVGASPAGDLGGCGLLVIACRQAPTGAVCPAGDLGGCGLLVIACRQAPTGGC